MVESDELSEEDPLVDPIERPEALCGNGVVEAGEVCDLGLENGEWDEGRSWMHSVPSIVRTPSGEDLYLEVSHRRLSRSGSLMEMYILTLTCLGGLCGAHFEIRGDIHFHHDSPVIHVDFPLLTHLTGVSILMHLQHPTWNQFKRRISANRRRSSCSWARKH